MAKVKTKKAKPEKLRPLPPRMAGYPKSEQEAKKRGVSYWYTLGADSKTRLHDKKEEDWKKGRVTGKFSPKYPDDSEYAMYLRLVYDLGEDAAVQLDQGSIEIDPKYAWLYQKLGPEPQTEPAEKFIRQFKLDGEAQTARPVKRPAPFAPGGAKPRRAPASASEGAESEAKRQRRDNAKQTGAVDRFGVRLGTRTARINAALSATPKTTQQIEEEADAKSIGSHLSKMVRLGYVQKVGKGQYVLTPKYQENGECDSPSPSTKAKQRSSANSAKTESTRPAKGSSGAEKVKSSRPSSSSRRSPKAKPAKSAKRRSARG